jgi:hypothetical protein
VPLSSPSGRTADTLAAALVGSIPASPRAAALANSGLLPSVPETELAELAALLGSILGKRTDQGEACGHPRRLALSQLIRGRPTGSMMLRLPNANRLVPQVPLAN